MQTELKTNVFCRFRQVSTNQIAGTTTRPLFVVAFLAAMGSRPISGHWMGCCPLHTYHNRQYAIHHHDGKFGVLSSQRLASSCNSHSFLGQMKISILLTAKNRCRIDRGSVLSFGRNQQMFVIAASRKSDF